MSSYIMTWVWNSSQPPGLLLCHLQGVVCGVVGTGQQGFRSSCSSSSGQRALTPNPDARRAPGPVIRTSRTKRRSERRLTRVHRCSRFQLRMNSIIPGLFYMVRRGRRFPETTRAALIEGLGWKHTQQPPIKLQTTSPSLVSL